MALTWLSGLRSINGLEPGGVALFGCGCGMRESRTAISALTVYSPVGVPLHPLKGRHGAGESVMRWLSGSMIIYL